MASAEVFFESRIITREPPESVVYDLRQTQKTTITLPAGSKWASGLHWHQDHTEFLRIVRGSVQVTLGNSVMIATSAGIIRKDGQDVPPTGNNELRVDKGVFHDWRRADAGTDPDGEEIIVEERTEPNDGEKQDFFWRVNDVVLRGTANLRRSRSVPEGWREEWRMWFKLMTVFWRYDNYPVAARIPPWISRRNSTLAVRIERAISYVILIVAATLTQLVGWKVSRRSDFPIKTE